MPKQAGESDYDWGYLIGFSDEIVQHVWHHFSTEFCRGYQDGRNAIEAICEDVTESRYFQ